MGDEKLKKADVLKMRVHDLPEIAIVTQEIERFKKSMLQNPTHEEEEDGYRAVAERHFLNGLERAREVLLLGHYRSLPKSQGLMEFRRQ